MDSALSTNTDIISQLAVAKVFTIQGYKEIATLHAYH